MCEVHKPEKTEALLREFFFESMKRGYIFSPPKTPIPGLPGSKSIRYEQGKESGFLANSGESWTLSLSINRQKKSVIEAFAARTDSDGTVVIEAQVPKVDVHEQGFVAPPQTDSYSTACQYVPSYGISFGCWSLPDNPLGYYYTTVYRYGQTTDPYSQWWACWQGSIHVCPQIEHPSSPFTWITCGFPPSHPQG